MEKALKRWARKYGVEVNDVQRPFKEENGETFRFQDKYTASVEEHKREHEEFERSINKLGKALTTFFREYVKIGKDKRMTMDSLMRKNQALYNKLDEKQKEVASFIIQRYLMSLEGGPGGDGGCSGDCGGFPGSGGGFPGSGGGFPGSDGGYPGDFGGFQGGSGGFAGMNEGYPKNYDGYYGNEALHGNIDGDTGIGPPFSSESNSDEEILDDSRRI
uniref:DUF148 domain-containing protein n=1 Tax=Angiostrongylus cantonensis TaxID=6313 RepID=A0A0K0DCV5_ANGCA